MNTESIDLPNGYTAHIARDECAENPFEVWDCGPSITVFYDRSLATYGEEVDAVTLFDLIPAAQFQTCKGRREVLDALPDVTRRDYADALRGSYHSAAMADRSKEALRELLPERPQGWRSAGNYFDCMESLASLAGIPCFYGQSNGYCQGDSSLVFVTLTPAWREKVGNITTEHDAGNLQGAFDLYSAWAWGDVYGVASIHRPATLDDDGDEVEGEEIDDGSCWGFYGSNHDKSGLMEHCKSMVAYDLQWLAKESAAAHDAACRDVATV
jgi:hypothetical protein